MDLVVLRRLVAELSARLAGQRVDQVYALPRYDVALVLSERGSPRVWFSADPEDPRLYLRHGGHRSPSRPPAFAMAARKWARGQRISELALVGDDRVVRLGLASEAALVFELVPRRASGYVLEPDGTVAAVWNPRRGRPGPGDDWSPPERRPRTPASAIDAPAWEHMQSAVGDDRQLIGMLMRQVAGMTRLVAREVATRVREEGSLSERVAEELERTERAPDEPRVYSPYPLEELRDAPDPDQLVVAPYPLRHLNERDAIPFDSLIDAAEAYYGTRARLRRVAAVRGAVGAAARSRIASLERTREKVSAQHARPEDADRLREIGDLLLAAPRALVEDGVVSLPDLYGDGQPMKVKVDPSRSLADNAERYYRRARRTERRLSRQGERLARLEREEESLRRLLDDAEAVAAPEECDRLLGRAAALGLEIDADRARVPEASGGAPAHEPPERSTQRRRVIPGVRRYRGPDGSEILVGRSAKGNDKLSHRVASRDDWWLHARGPGSHVVLRNPARDDEPPEESLRSAATLAAWFSKARHATKVEVNWTRVRDLKKPRGAAPGLVLLERHRTLLVAPASPEELGLEPLDSDAD